MLADGLQAACASGATRVIDAATLTGAAVMAVGRNYNAIFSPSQPLLALTQQKAALVAENVWPLPLEPWHKEMCFCLCRYRQQPPGKRWRRRWRFQCRRFPVAFCQ